MLKKKMWSQHFFVFLEIKKHKKSHWEKLCRRERLRHAKSLKDTARKHNLLNVIAALGDIHRQSSSANPPARHQTGKTVCCVYASIFVERGGNFTARHAGPVSSSRSSRIP